MLGCEGTSPPAQDGIPSPRPPGGAAAKGDVHNNFYFDGRCARLLVVHQSSLTARTATPLFVAAWRNEAPRGASAAHHVVTPLLVCSL